MDRNDAIGEAITRELAWAEQECAEATNNLTRQYVCEQLVGRLNALMAPIGGSARYHHPGTISMIYPDGGVRHRLWT